MTRHPIIAALYAEAESMEYTGDFAPVMEGEALIVTVENERMRKAVAFTAVWRKAHGEAWPAVAMENIETAQREIDKYAGRP